MLEKELEAKLKPVAKKMKGLYLKFWPLSFTGFPDRMLLLPGARIYFIEWKRPGKKIISGSKQDYVRSLLQTLGFAVVEMNTQQQLNEFIISITITQFLK